MGRMPTNMDHSHSNPSTGQGTQNYPRLTQLTWLPVPLLALVIAVLWIADLRTVYESRVLMVLLNLFFTWLASLCICLLTARGFLGSGQPGLLMFGCGSMLWGVTSLIAAGLVDHVNTTITVHNLGVLGAALCHLVGLLWRGRRLPRPGRWLVVGYAGALLTSALIVWAAMAGLTPVFFVQGQGGTWVREVVLLLAVTMFAWVAWQLITKSRRQSGAFYYWYGLGLALVATGLTGGVLLSVQGGILGWTNRLTQYLGSAYLFIAVIMAARETGTRTLTLTTVEEVWQENDFLAGFQQQTPLGWALRYGLAVAAVAGAMGVRLALTAWFGPGLPAYITFYPAVMIVALLVGLGPGLIATALAGFAAAYWILPPVGQFALTLPMDRLGLVIFVGMGLFMSVVAELSRRYRHKAAAYDREAALREGHARLAAFAEATFEGIVETEAGRILDCNEQFARVSGFTVGELRGVQIASLIAPEDHDRVMANIQQGRESVTEHTMLHKDGTRIVVEAHGRPVTPGSARRHTAVRDITVHKQAEEQMRLLSGVVEAASNGIVITDREGKILWVNPAFTKLTGYTTAEAVGQNPRVLKSGQHSLEFYRDMWETVLCGKVWHRELVNKRKDGSLYSEEMTITPIRVAGEAISRFIAIKQDITDRKRAEEALRESEVRYRTLFNSIDAGFCIIELIFDAAAKPVDYRFLEVNAAFEKQTGLQAAQGKLMRELAPAHEAHWFEIYGKIALTGEAVRFVNEASALNRWYDVYAYRVGAPESRQVAILFNDITAHKQAETELRRRAEELRAANDELTRFNRVTVGRELRIIELKKQVNELCASLGRPPRYEADFGEQAPPAKS
jgi:PAS domain S-box-containing protein